MNRERVLRLVMVLVGLLFLTGIYPVAASLWYADQSTYTDDMMLSIYFTLGIFTPSQFQHPRSLKHALSALVMFVA